MKLPDFKEAFQDIYESKFFPMYCLCGGVLLTGLTSDYIWTLGGLGAFLVFLVKGRVT